jgi:uncharacterized protein
MYRKYWQLILIFPVMGSLLWACSLPSRSIPAIALTDAQQQGQKLPLSAQLKVNNQKILLEVARTAQEGRIGLMYRKNLPDNRGMMFVFEPARPTKFWMKNTLIPLDMIFVENGTIRYLATQVPPCKADPCPVYGPELDVKIDRVIELNSGRASTLKLKVGDKLDLQDIKPINR